jgi:hypothetical protein
MPVRASFPPSCAPFARGVGALLSRPGAGEALKASGGPPGLAPSAVETHRFFPALDAAGGALPSKRTDDVQLF